MTVTKLRQINRRRQICQQKVVLDTELRSLGVPTPIISWIRRSDGKGNLRIIGITKLPSIIRAPTPHRSIHFDTAGMKSSSREEGPVNLIANPHRGRFFFRGFNTQLALVIDAPAPEGTVHSYRARVTESRNHGEPPFCSDL